MPAKSQAVEAVPDSATRQAIMQAVSELGRDSTQVQDQIMQAILSAETEEELFAILEQSTLDARSRLEVPLRVKTVTLNESGFKDGPPAYCVLEVTNLNTNKDEMITCGAGSVLAGMIKLHQLGALPIDVVLFERNETVNGFKPIAFRRAMASDERF